MKNTHRSAHARRLSAVFISVLLFFMYCSVLAGAQESFWEGRISAAPYGNLPNRGFYAASNAFPLDTKVKITHPENGTEIEVRVVERLDQDRIFMQISPEAADAFGLRQNEIINARVSALSEKNSLIDQPLAEESALSSDPDINPAAETGGGGRSLIEEYLALQDTSKQSEEASSAVAPVFPEEETQSEDLTGESEEIAEESQEQIAEQEAAAEEESPAETEAIEEDVTELVEEKALEEAPEEKVAVEPAEEEAEKEAEEVTEAVPDTETETEEPVIKSVHAMPEQSAPSDEEVAFSLPAPALKSAETANEAPAEDKTAEVEEAAEESSVPKVVSIEPVFPREKDRSYSASAPKPPVDRESREGPRASLALVEAESGDTALSLAPAHAPQLPGEDRPAPDLASAEETPDEGAEEDTELAHQPALPAEEEPLPEEPVETVEVKPEETAEIPEDAELVLVPAEERPPEGYTEDESEEAAAAEDRPEEGPEEKEAVEPETPEQYVSMAGEIPVQESLETASYYLQVGAYSRLDLAKRRAGELVKDYPVTIYTDTAEASVPRYKLMIGPLNEDESGTLLFTFTARGYRDAFIRRGN